MVALKKREARLTNEVAELQKHNVDLLEIERESKAKVVNSSRELK